MISNYNDSIIPEEPENSTQVKPDMNSILESVKTMLNIELDDTAFDTDIIFGINTAFAILQQIGVGPKEGFNVVDNTQQWQDYAEGAMYSMVQQYVYLKTKVIFDPPTNSFLLSAYNDRINELEWRLKVTAEEIFDDTPVTIEAKDDD